MAVTIIAETTGESLHPVTSQLIGAAVSLGEEAHVICPGGFGSEEVSKIVGVERVTAIIGDCFEVFDSNAWAESINICIKEGESVILASSTSKGREISATIAAKRKIPIIQDVVSLSGDMEITRPIYSGKAVETSSVTGDCIITLRPNAFEASEIGNNAPVNILNQSANVRIAVQEAIAKASERLDVSEADIIISGGRGMGSVENFSHLEEIADIIGAAVGASRAVVDEWNMPHSMQVGQTGKTVTPSLYIAVGISGAIQHLAGMRSSKYIVAINKDPDAPIFSVADYGIISSWEEALPIVKSELMKLN